MRHRRHQSWQQQRGFTAVEIAMVATIIAIIALLILPIYRKRTEEARIAAVQDELQSIVKATLLIEADISNLPTARPQDLDNWENDTESVIPADNRSKTPPYAGWNYTVGFLPGGAAGLNNRDTTILRNWQGPYLAVRRTAPISDLIALDPGWLYPNGPVYIVGTTGPNFTDGGGNSIQDDPNDRYPVDPWGNPYLLFGQGRLNPTNTSESDFRSRVVYSLGPNGVPGNGPAGAGRFRRLGDLGTGLLGSGDDYEFEF